MADPLGGTFVEDSVFKEDHEDLDYINMPDSDIIASDQIYTSNGEGGGRNNSAGNIDNLSDELEELERSLNDSRVESVNAMVDRTMGTGPTRNDGTGLDPASFTSPALPILDPENRNNIKITPAGEAVIDRDARPHPTQVEITVTSPGDTRRPNTDLRNRKT